MERMLHDLVIISRRFGIDSNYIIAGGGNTSYKNEEKIWVKASGVSMADIREEGFVCLDRKKIKILSDKKYSDDSSLREIEVKADLSAAILYPEGKRPSVETSMHEIIDYPYIVHTHPTLMNGLLCGKDSKSITKKIFGEEVVYIPYTDPGYVLFKAVYESLKKYREKYSAEPSVIFLENHGVFVGADSIDDIEKIYADLSMKIKAEVSCETYNDEPSDGDELTEYIEKVKEVEGLENSIALSDNSELSLHYVLNNESFRDVSTPFTPDIIVYCKSQYLFIEKLEELKTSIVDFKVRTGYFPKVIAVKGKGILAIEDNSNSAKIVMDVFKDMMKLCNYSKCFGGPRPMNKEQIDFIDNWEVENYRRSVSKKA